MKLKSTNMMSWLGVLFFCFYLFGLINPVDWWGAHFLAFLPFPWKLGLLTLSGLLVMASFLPYLINWLKPIGKLMVIPARFTIPIITILMGFCFYFFPIFHDYYGDSFEYEGLLNSQIISISEFTLEPLFSTDLSPHMGRVSMASLVNLMSYVFGLNYLEVFVWMDLVCGVLFIFLWLTFVSRFINDFSWRLVLSIAGLSAPFLQIFFGHVEMYAPSLLLLEVCLIMLVYALEKRKAWLLYLLLPLLIISVRFHATFLLLLPAWLLALLHLSGRFENLAKRVFTPKGITLYVLVPIFTLGFILYFIILGDHDDPRTLHGAQDFERIFLPIISPEAPFDRYNMQSWNHIFDFFNVTLHWSPIALLLLVGIAIIFRKRFNRNRPTTLVLMLSFLLYVIFLFAVNPLLSMQIDWDLFMLPAPLLLVLTAVLVKEVEEEKVVTQRVIPIALALSFLTIPFFAVNATAKPYSQRLESLSIRIFKTYNIWADKYLEYAVKLTSAGDEYLERKQKVIDELRPLAVIGNDLHFAQMITQNGLHYLNEGDLVKAQICFQEAYYYYPTLKSNILNLLQTNFRLGRYEEAYSNAVELIAYKYPNEKKSQRMTIHCALEAGFYEEALNYSSQYLIHFPEDSLIQRVNSGLVTNKNVNQLKRLFARKPIVQD